MRRNTGIQGRLQSPYSIEYLRKKCFNGKLRCKGGTLSKGQERGTTTIQGGTKRHRNRCDVGTKKEGTSVWRELGKSDVTRDPSTPEGRSCPRGPPPTRPPAPLETRPQHASAATPPRVTPQGPPTSLQREQRDGRPSPPRLSRALLSSLPERSAFDRHFRGFETWSTFIRNVRGGSDFPPMGMAGESTPKEGEPHLRTGKEGIPEKGGTGKGGGSRVCGGRYRKRRSGRKRR